MSSNYEENWVNLSASRLNQDCMATLNYRYNEKLVSPPNIYQVLGDVGERGIEAILRNHSQAGFDPHIVEAECWKCLEERITATELDAPSRQDVQSVIDAVMQFSPSANYVLRATQEWVEFNRPDIIPRKIRGPLDFRGEEYGRVVIDDTKVSGRMVNKPKKEWILQLGVYALAVKQMLSLDYLPTARIIFLYRGKTPSCKVMEIDLSAEAISDIFIAARNIEQCIQSGYWPPNRRSQYCNEWNCNFWFRCHEDYLVSMDVLLNENMSTLPRFT